MSDATTQIHHSITSKYEQWLDEIGRLSMYWTDGLSAVELMVEELYKQRHIDVVKNLHYLAMCRDLRSKMQEWKAAEWAKLFPSAEVD